MAAVFDIGDLSENSIREALDEAFGADFVFRSPKRKDVKKVEEATDVLVLFDDVALIVESKARALRDGEPWDDPDPRWAKKHIGIAFAQLQRAARLFREGKFGLVENARRSGVSVDLSTVRHLYGLIVVNHKSDPYHATELAPELVGAPIPTKVLSLNDLLNVAAYLDTPNDLLCYLEARYALEYPKLQPRVHEENLAFEYYVKHFEQITAKRSAALGHPIDEKLMEPYGTLWRKFLAGEMEDAKYGLFFDKIIEYMHKSTERPVTPEEARSHNPPRQAEYAEGATLLSSYARLKRIAIGKRMIKCIEDADRSGRGQSFRTYSKEMGIMIMFWVTHHPPEQQADRVEELVAFTCLAHLAGEAKRTVGIATEGHLMGPRSTDVAVAKFDRRTFPPEILEQGKERAQALWGTMGGRMFSALDP